VEEEKIELTAWNRELVNETIGVLEACQNAIADAVSRLKSLRRINTGGPTIARRPEMDSGKEAAPAA